jgi:hypothetical protein
MAEEGLLQLVIKRRSGGESFNRCHFAALDLSNSDQAGTHRLAFEQDRAGATVTGIASDLGSHKSETLPQHPGKPFHR